MTTGPTQTLSIAQAAALAAQNFEDGEHSACAYLCEQILLQSRNHAMANHLLGLIAHRSGDTQAALRLLETSLAAAPKDAMIVSNVIEVLRSSGDAERARQIGQKAMEDGANSPGLWANLALAHYDNGALDTARDLHLAALEKAPNHLASLNNLGSIARDQKNPDGAIAWYQKALAVAPQHTESRNNLATVLIECDRYEDAQAEAQFVLNTDPQNSEAMRCLGRIALARADLDAAETWFRKSITMAPKEMRGYLGLSQVLLDKNHPRLALQQAEKARACAPHTVLALHQVGVCLSNLHDVDAARDHYNAALDVQADFVPSLLGRGYLALEMGDQDRAEADFRSALASDQDQISALVALSRIKKVTAEDDPILTGLSEFERISKTLAPQKRVSLHYALGDIHDGLGDYDTAFAQFQTGATAKRALVHHDPDHHAAWIDKIIATVTAEKLAELKAFANPSARPILVVGMPRSGTTLTESILAAHPDVHGAGELNDLQTLFGIDASDPTQSYPRNLIDLDGAVLTAKIEAYLTELGRLGGSAARVTDKMPANFLLLGVIHALLPNARIIHVMRDPMDTCLSCFTRLFERSQVHSYDLTELGRYYREYRKVMQHWSSILPKGAFYALQYEDLVANPEKQARALLDFCALPWDPACLNFHTARRRVRTASVTQVRQPIYQASVRKWHRYRAHLEPLAALIGDI